MRLSPQELDAIHATVAAVDPLGRVYLYGSRADDRRKGGDIDLFLEASKPIDAKTELLLTYRLSAACDTKVDLMVKIPGDEELPIYSIARKGVLL